MVFVGAVFRSRYLWCGTESVHEKDVDDGCRRDCGIMRSLERYFSELKPSGWRMHTEKSGEKHD